MFAPYAGQASIILKASAYSVQYHPTYDTPVADVEEAVRFGADAISVGCIVGGPDQAQQCTFRKISKEAASAGHAACRAHLSEGRSDQGSARR